MQTLRNIQYISGSWQGLQRDSNKDGYEIIDAENYYIFLVFDGVSSSQNAQMGVATLIRFCEENHQIYFKNNIFDLKHMMEDMNICLLRSGLEFAETTCCAAYVPKNSAQKITISHLGDSRIYALGERIKRCTRDDNHPKAPHLLTKYFGIRKISESDFYETSFNAKASRLLMCTDGFYFVMEDNVDYFQNVFKSPSLDKAKLKIQQAIEGRNYDDATYILVQM
ncbi:MAG: protein phosphatase 2C domain-containing protein [Spirochaetia bacterium]|nr:protein phosphatase 2C domain-containing protein [Spirochaetia bacterium]